jgi:hypothetical protein
MIPLPDKTRVLLPFRDTMSSDSQPFRVGVVFDGPGAPRWVDSLITFLKELPGIEVCPIIFGGPASTDARPSWLVDRLYSVSRQKFDPLAEVDRKNGESGGDRTETLDSIRALGCGVVIWLSSGGEHMNLAGLAKHGILTCDSENGQVRSPSGMRWPPANRHLRRPSIGTIPRSPAAASFEKWKHRRCKGFTSR